MRSVWTRLWLLWVSLAVGGFFAIELPAVFNEEPGDTLTEHVVSFVPMEVAVGIFGALVGLMVWLWVHFKVRYGRKKRKRS